MLHRGGTDIVNFYILIEFLTSPAALDLVGLLRLKLIH